MNAADDGLAGIQQLAGDATLLFYMSEEAQEGRDAYVEQAAPGLRPVPEATVNHWVAGARPRTLPASVVPVLVGTACAAGEGDVIAWRAIAAGGRGARAPDRHQLRQRLQRRRARHRRGASRPGAAGGVGTGGAGRGEAGRLHGLRRGRRRRPRPRPRHVVVADRRRRGVHRRRLVLHRRPEAVRLPRPRRGVRVRVLRPRGHRRHHLRAARTDHGPGVVAATAVGFLACALLVANNLRDIPTDATAGKKTLAVRLGDARTRWLYAGLLGGAFVAGVACMGWRWGAVACLLAAPLAVRPIRLVLARRTRAELDRRARGHRADAAGLRRRLLAAGSGSRPDDG